jgi:hypothetical protein
MALQIRKNVSCRSSQFWEETDYLLKDQIQRYLPTANRLSTTPG